MTAADPDRIAERIAEYRARYGRPGMTAAEFAEHLPEDLRGPYWRAKLDEFFAAQGIDPDTVTGDHL